MTARVQRFPLQHGENHVAMPRKYPWSGAQVLSVAFEPGHSEISLWALCASDPTDEERTRFLVLETGEITKADLSHAQFVGTAVSQLLHVASDSGFGCRHFVWHVFELFGGAR
jgi:hypothetical protein